MKYYKSANYETMQGGTKYIYAENSELGNVSAIEEFDNLIGMEAPKRQLHKFLAFFYMQKVAYMRGMKKCSINTNMIFIGNPGTGKTECARLLAKTLEEAGITNKVPIVECGRADIVAKYVGHTAKNVKALVRKALGGVLFIDEAYSLCESGEGANFGEEAINALIQEVESHRGKLVVILAGYPDKMEEFVASNPGIKSRFPIIVHFSDYSSEQLYEISERIAEKNGFSFSQDVKAKLIPIFKDRLREENCGNARLARNMVEDAILNKAYKLEEQYGDLSILPNNKLFTLTGADFEVLSYVGEYVKKKKVGF